MRTGLSSPEKVVNKTQRGGAGRFRIFILLRSQDSAKLVTFMCFKYSSENID